MAAMTRGDILKLLVSGAFLVLIGLKIDWTGFWSMFGRINPWYFALSICISGVMVLSSCAKWQVMLRLQKAKPGFPFLLRTYFVGYFFTVLLPSNVGGDAVRSYYTGKEVGDQYTSAVSIFMERFTGFIFLLLLAILGPLVKPELLSTWRIVVPAAGSVLLLLMFLVFAVHEGLVDRANALVLRVADAARGAGRADREYRSDLAGAALDYYRRLFEKIRKFDIKLRRTAGYFRHRPGYLAAAVLLTLLFYMIAWINVLVAFRTFGVEVQLLDLIALLPAIILVSMVPISLGGIGLAEGAYVFYFALVGVPAESALIMSLLLRFKLMLLATVGFLFYVTRTQRREDDVARAAEAQRNIGA